MKQYLLVALWLLLGAGIGFLVMVFANRSDISDCTDGAAISSETVAWLTQNPPWEALTGDVPERTTTGPRGSSEYQPDEICEGYVASWSGPREGLNFFRVGRYPGERDAEGAVDDKYYADSIDIETSTHLEQVDVEDEWVHAIYQQDCLIVDVVWSRGPIASGTPKDRDKVILPLLDAMATDLCAAVSD